MTTDTAHVLAAIDGAVRDWETSSDAMRWVPDGDDVPALPGKLLADWVSLVSDPPPPPSQLRITVDTEGFARALNGMAAVVSRMVQDFGKATQSFGRAVAAMSHDLDAKDNPKAHVRCARCHPCANPGPMLGVKPSLPAGRRHRRKR